MSSAKQKSGTVPNAAQKRRNRRKKLQNSCMIDEIQDLNIEAESKPKKEVLHLHKEYLADQENDGPCNCPDCSIVKVDIGTMTNDPIESREKVKAAREAKKLAKQQAKLKRDAGLDIKQPAKAPAEGKSKDIPKELAQEVSKEYDSKEKEGKDKVPHALREQPVKGKAGPKELPVEDMTEDEVDRAGPPIDTIKTDLQQIKPGKELVKKAAQKTATDIKKKDTSNCDVPSVPATMTPKSGTDMTVRDVIETLRGIKNVAQEVKDVTTQIQALNLDKKKLEKKATSTPTVQGSKSTDTKLKGKDIPPSDEASTISAQTEEGGKSKAELRAERRAKQEAQRAAKEAATQVKAVIAKPKDAIQPSKEVGNTASRKEKSPKPKTPKQTAKPQDHKVSWFRHLYNEDHKAKLNMIPINSNLHPAIIKLGVQLATRVVTGSNARCIALLDALKKMVQDYSLPAKTEFGRGLDAHLATSLEFLWAMRQPTASQTNAVKFFRHHLTQLPNNVDEFDAKKTLQEEIDRYIREQIDMAGEAISITVRNKISKGDNILTYGCSSLIERILVDAYLAGVEFRAVVCGGGVAAPAAREMTRRLAARGVPCICVDITALSFVMRTVNKVVLGCSSLLANGSVLGAAGTAAVALAARGYNKPVLVACETHKFSERVQTDAFVYNEIGDPDELIDKSDENSPLKDWRSNPNLTPLNLTYDVTPPNLVTAVVTELAILPCTSAPVVLRFKLSEYSI